jgi:large subunit GTPase 1
MVEEKNSDIKITPYEKNIEVWKQLWRVVDRADMIIQIVDGRDALFFRSEDLEEYVKEVNPNKKSLILVNKSDLVSP